MFMRVPVCAMTQDERRRGKKFVCKRLAWFNETQDCPLRDIIFRPHSSTALLSCARTGSNIDQTPTDPALVLFHQRQGTSDTPRRRQAISPGFCGVCRGEIVSSHDVRED